MTARAACHLSLPLILALIAPAARAGSFRIEFIATIDEKRVEGAEICFFEGTSSGALAQFAMSGDVRCLPADKVIDLPDGGWNFFARYRNERISAWPGMVLVSDHHVQGGFKKVGVPMSPAVLARVDESLRGEHVVFYFPGTINDKPPYAYPLPPGEVDVLLPADADFIPLVMRDGRVTVAGDVQRVTTELRSVTVKPSGAVDVVVPIKMQVMDLGDFLPEPPRATIALADGRVVEPIVQIRGISRYDIAVFRGVPRTTGPLRLRVGGGAWRTDEATIPAPAANEVAMPSQPLETVPGSIVHVSWAIEGTPPPTSASACDATAAESEEPARVLTLYRCRDAFSTAPLSIRLNDCHVVATRALDTTRPRGVESFEGISAGEYMVRLAAHDAVRWVPVLAPDHETGRADATIAFAMVSGTITVDGEPSAARIAFSTGAGASDASGRYTAIVSSNPGAAAVEVTLCGGEQPSFVVMPKHTIGANTTFDVRLSAKPLRVTLRDAATKRPIEDATTLVRYPMNEADGDRLTRPGPASDATGLVAVTGLSADAAVRVCGSHPKYQRACTAVLTRDARDTVLELTPTASFRGRIAGANGVEGGRFFFVAPGGAVAEHGSVRTDGTFDYQRPHAAPEYVVFVSRSAPLAVVDRWRTTGEELTVELPPAPLRSVRVTLAPDAAIPRAQIALAVGDRLVPGDAFTFHQAMRRQQPLVVANGTTVIADVLETAPLAVIRGLDPSAPAPDGVDLFTLREYRASFPAVVVRGDGVVLP